MSSNIDNIPIISFFTGGGFMDMGFEKAGFKTIYANEFNPRIARAFDYSFNNWAKRKKHDRVILSLDSIDLVDSNEVKSLMKNEIEGKIFGVIGGPPCQDFSVSGDVQGLKGARGKYTVSFIDKILDLEPHFFTMENVKGLPTFKSLKNDFDFVTSEFSKKYWLTYDVHNSLSYNVPQHRERLIMIGIRKDLVNFMIGENLKEYLIFKKVGQKFNRKTVLTKSQMTEKYLLNGKSNKKNHVFPNLTESSKIKIKKIKEGETNRRSFRRISRSSYSPTLSFGHNEIFLHPTEDRRLSVRECLRLQGVDDSYHFKEDVSLTTMYKIISNGVPVPLAKEIGLRIKEFIKLNIS